MNNITADLFKPTNGHLYYTGDKPKKLAFSSSDDAVRQRRVYAWRDHLSSVLENLVRKNDSTNLFRDQISSMPLTWEESGDQMPSLAGRLSIPTSLRQFEEWRAAGRYEGLDLAKCKVNAEFDNFQEFEGQTAGESVAIFQKHHFPGLRLAAPKEYFELNGDNKRPSDDALNVIRTIMSAICCNVENTTAGDVRNGYVKNLNFYTDTLVKDHCKSGGKNDFLRVCKYVRFMGRGELSHIKSQTLFDITKLMLKRLMTNNAINVRFPQGTPMGGSRFRAQFSTTPDRFGPFAESITLLLCVSGSNPLQWENLINALATKRRIEFNPLTRDEAHPH
jgi:hypothetical protein